MAVQLINLTAMTEGGWGVTADETGINIREFKSTIEPEFIENLPGKSGEVRGSAVAAMKLTVDISGEQLTATGIMAAVATTGYTTANSSAYFGAPTTGKYLTRAEVTESRDGWTDVSVSFEAFAGRT